MLVLISLFKGNIFQKNLFCCPINYSCSSDYKFLWHFTLPLLTFHKKMNSTSGKSLIEMKPCNQFSLQMSDFRDGLYQLNSSLFDQLVLLKKFFIRRIINRAGLHFFFLLGSPLILWIYKKWKYQNKMIKFRFASFLSPWHNWKKEKTKRIADNFVGSHQS